MEVKAGERGWTAWATHAALGEEVGCSIYLGSAPRALDADAPPWGEEIFEAQPGEVSCNL